MLASVRWEEFYVWLVQNEWNKRMYDLIVHIIKMGIESEQARWSQF